MARQTGPHPASTMKGVEPQLPACLQIYELIRMVTQLSSC